VRFDKTGVLKGFIIFLTATACPVSWSFAELHPHQYRSLPWPAQLLSYHTSPKAPMPTGCRSVYLDHSQSPRTPPPAIFSSSSYLLVISNVVPKIWARTNSAMLSVLSLAVHRLCDLALLIEASKPSLLLCVVKRDAGAAAGTLRSLVGHAGMDDFGWRRGECRSNSDLV
jgi:hypothetical protein